MKLYTILILSLTLSSCGNSQKDAESEKKAIADSVKKAVLEQVNEKERIENDRKFQIEKNNKISELSIQIENLQSDLINEKAKLIEVEKPKFLRSAAEKENQVRNQETIISGIEESIENIRASLRTLQSSNATIAEYKIEEVIGCWFVPHSATINIKFERNGRFKFNDYNSSLEIDEVLKGSWELKGEQLSLLYDDRPMQKFRIYKGKDGDTNYYIEKKGYYFVKGEACN